MNAADIAKALGARKTGGQWMAVCPSHEDSTPSLAHPLCPEGRLARWHIEDIQSSMSEDPGHV